MLIETFDDLLRTAREQADAQRLLFVFTCSVLPDDATEEQRKRFEAGLGGALVPMLEVDKLPDEIREFNQLVEESTQFAQNHQASDWSIVFVAALGGEGKRPPRSQDCDLPLRRMVDDIRMGNIQRFIAFDRNGIMTKLS